MFRRYFNTVKLTKFDIAGRYAELCFTCRTLPNVDAWRSVPLRQVKLASSNKFIKTLSIWLLKQ